jgi:hypothetical protein
MCLVKCFWIEVERRRDDVGDSFGVGVAQADLEVGAEGLGDVLMREVAQWQAGQQVDPLADQMAVREEVVAGGCAGLPPRHMGGHVSGCRACVVQVLKSGGVVEAGHTPGV